MLGRVPQTVVDDEDGSLRTTLEASLELRGLSRVADNAQHQYLRSRPAPSPESIKRAKELDVGALGLHPLFSESLGAVGEAQSNTALYPHPNVFSYPACPPKAHAVRNRSCRGCSWWTESGATVPGR